MSATQRVQSRAEALRKRGRRLDREAAIARKAQQNAEKRAAESQNRRAHGRMLDQVEHCYRQYAPSQIHQAQAMKDCNVVDAAFDAGEVEWRDDLICQAGA